MNVIKKLILGILGILLSVGIGTGLHYYLDNKSSSNSVHISSSENVVANPVTTPVVPQSSPVSASPVQRNCSQEKFSVVSKYKNGSSMSSIDPIILTGLVHFPNDNFPFNLFTVQAGIIDESPVNVNGSFCLVSNKLLKAVAISVSRGDNIILMSLATSTSDQGIFIIDTTSTAVAILDTVNAALLPPVVNQEVMKFIYTLPESLRFIDVVSKALLGASSTSSLDSILKMPDIKNLEELAGNAVNIKLQQEINGAK